MFKKNKFNKIVTLVFAVYFLINSNISVHGLSVNSQINTSNTLSTVNSVDELNVLQLSLAKAVEMVLEEDYEVEIAALNLKTSKQKYRKDKNDIEEIKEVLDDDYYKLKNIINLNLEFAESEYQYFIDNKKVEIEKLYYNVLRGNREIEIYTDNKNFAEELLKKVEKNLSTGGSAQLDVDTCELNYLKSQMKLNDIKNKLKADKITLNAMLGLNMNDEVILTDNFDYTEFKNINIDEVLDKTSEKQFRFKRSKLDKENANYEFYIIKKKFAEITFEYKEKEVEAKKADMEFENIKKEIQKDIRLKYNMILQKREAIENNEKSVEVTQNIFNQVSSMYNDGLKTLDELVKAQESIKSEKLELAKNILDYNISVLELNKMLEAK